MGKYQTMSMTRLAITPQRANILVLIGFLAAVFTVGGVAGAATTPEIAGWYAHLAKPSWNPPNWVFGPVWSMLYLIIAIAAWTVWKQPRSPMRSQGLMFWWIQLAFNFAWSIFFFSFHWLGIALIDIALLGLSTGVTLIRFVEVRRPAGFALIPYLLWICFAATLNGTIWRMN
jgi:tryptophan-rich sensory protein